MHPVKSNKQFRRTAQKVPVLYAVLMAIFLSRIVWYDLRTISAANSESNDLVLYFIIWSVLLSPFLFMHLVKGVKLAGYYWLPNCILLLAAYSTITGLLLNNQFQFVIQDLFKFLFIPAVFFATYKLPLNITSTAVLKMIAKIILIYYCFRIVIFLLFNDSGRVYYGTPQDVFAICVNLAILISGNKSIRPPFLVGKLSILSLLSVIGQKKTIAVGVVLVFTMTFFKSFVGGNLRTLGKFVFIIVSLIGVLAWLLITAQVDLKRFTNMNIDNDLGEDSRRKIEVAVAMKTLDESRFGYLFGLGGGVTLNVPSIKQGQMVISTTHSMHNTVVTMMTRHGLFGLFVYFAVLIYGLFWAFRNRSNENTDIFILANVTLFYKLFAFLASFVIYGVVDDALLAVLAGLILRYTRVESATKQQIKSRKKMRKHVRHA